MCTSEMYRTIDAGSMVKAAERLATTQPAVSRAIADLEHSLGVRLLDRGPRGVVPTPYGSRRNDLPPAPSGPPQKPEVLNPAV